MINPQQRVHGGSIIGLNPAQQLKTGTLVKADISGVAGQHKQLFRLISDLLQ